MIQIQTVRRTYTQYAHARASASWSAKRACLHANANATFSLRMRITKRMPVSVDTCLRVCA